MSLIASPLNGQTVDRENVSEQFYKSEAKFKFSFPTPQKGGDVKFTYDKLELVRDEYAILLGSPSQPAKIVYQDVTLSADKITFNQKTKDATAEGHVIIDQGPQRLTAEHLVFNLTSKTGTFFRATAMFEPSIYFTGDSIEKLDDTTYRLTNGLFTSCELNKPAWSFHLKTATVTIDDYARLRGVSFRAREIPLLWTPYLIFPTKKDRAQGLLVPKVNYSSRFGASVQSAYFIPLGVSADATIHADIFSKGFAGLGTTVRYAPSVDITNGKLQAYVVTDPETRSREWKYEYTHAQDNLPGDLRAVVDIRDYSDLEFFRNFERSFAINTRSTIYSAAYLTRNRPTYSLNLRADRRENFRTCRDANGLPIPGECRDRFEQVPSLEYRSYPNQIASTPLYFSLESSASHLRNNQGADYFRGDVFPTLALRVKTPSWFSVRPQVSLRQTNYTSSRETVGGPPTGPAINRTYAQGEVELVGPSVSRIYDRDLGGFSRFKHLLEPRFRYLYTSNVENRDRIIAFDTVDTPFLPLVSNSVEYSLTQRVIAKQSGENSSAREILTVSLKQAVSLSEPFQQFRFGSSDTSRFTPLTLSAHLNPYQSVSVDANASFGNLSKQLDQTSVSANLSGKLSYLYLTWFSSFSSPNLPGRGSSQIRITSGGPLLRTKDTDRVRGDIQLSYDAKDNKLIEQRYILGTNASCFSVALEYRDFISLRRLSGAPSPRGGALSRALPGDFQLSISLKNVGSFIDLRGSINDLLQGTR
ncbi:MAG TPA: LPS assembly protein LptD [Thermoanaerobaculia bacterium]|nr:LPS assembly protein LptD [Thermoanaerobaculia bacterium]